MPLTRSTPFSAPELGARVAVTLGALAVYRLGVALPLPGLDVVRLYESGAAQALERFSVFGLGFSVFGLGLMPMMNALLLVEIVRLLSQWFNDWGGATPANTQRVNRWALVGALLLAILQAYGIAHALEEIPGAVADPGPEFQLTLVVTLVGGTALLAWLAALISWHGVGSGFWILLLAPYLAGLPAAIARDVELRRMGVLSEAGIVAILAYVLVAVASIAALGLVLARRRMPLERTLIWPLYISSILASFLFVVPWLFPDGPLRDTAVALLSPGAVLDIAALAVIIIAVSLAQSRRAEPRSAAGGASEKPADSAAAAPVVLTALALAAVALVPRFLAARLDVPIPVDGIQITTAVGIVLGVKSFLSGGRG